MAQQAIRVALDRAMASKRMNAPSVADELIVFDQAVDEGKVRSWRLGRTKLPRHLAQPLARLLGMTDDASDPAVVAKFGYDPMVMIRLFGLSPNGVEEDRLLSHRTDWPQDPTQREVIDRLRILERLELEVAANEQMLAVTEHDRAIQTVLAAVIRSGKYGVAFWPVQAGPSDYRRHKLHVSDRVDIRRLDGVCTNETEVWADLGDALQRASAQPSSSYPRWPGENRALVPDPHLSMWNLRRLDVPRRPRVRSPHPGLPAIAFTATVSSSWVGNLAGLVAMVLGYGVSSTIDLGRRLGNDPGYKASTEERLEVHSDLLRNPGDRRVWFHAAKASPDALRAPWSPKDGRTHPDLVHVHLVEDDNLLRATAEERSHYPDYTPALEHEWRRSRDLALQSKPTGDRILTLPVQHVEWASTSKWEHTFERVVQVLRYLDERLGIEPWPGLPAAQEQWAHDDPELVNPAFSWLRERAAPFVYAPQAVSADPAARHAMTVPSSVDPAPLSVPLLFD